MRAHHIALSPRLGLVIVYKQDLSEEQLAEVRRALAKIDGVTSTPVEKPPGKTGAAIFFSVAGAVNPATTLRAVKQVVNPELPISIGRFKFDWWPCDICGGYGTHASYFVKGLDPDNYEAFIAQSSAELLAIPVDELFPTPEANQKPLRDAIQAALNKVGAWSQVIQIIPHPSKVCLGAHHD